MTTAVPVPFTPITVTPRRHGIDLILTALSPISHHDPAVQDDSNRTVFNRQKQVVARSVVRGLPTQDQVDAITDAYPVPVDLAFMQDNSLPAFIGICLVRLLLAWYAGGEGTGLLTGLTRYERLEPRMRQEALIAPTVRVWWERLCRSLLLPPQAVDRSLELARLLFVPAVLGQQVLRALADESRAIMTQAQVWQDHTKRMDAGYAAKAGAEQVGDAVIHLHYAAEPADAAATPLIAEVPHVSANSQRQQIARGPAMRGLLAALGYEAQSPGRGALPVGVEAILANGGNIKAGAKQPADPFKLAHQIRDLFPSLELVGGVTDSFDLGESRLKVASWLVCRENAAALAGTAAEGLPTMHLSAFDLLDDVTLTRQAGEVGTGQMIFSFETLCAGTQLLVRLDLSPYTSALAWGALIDAVETFLAGCAAIGGQSARGFGRVAGQAYYHTTRDVAACRDAYRAYLAEHQERLRAALEDGTMGAASVVCS